MGWIIGFGMVVNLSLIVLGVVSVSTGWVLPWLRRHVTRPCVFGLGTLLMGVPGVVMGLYRFRFPLLPDVSWEVRHYSTTALLLCGLLFVGLGQLLPPRRQDVPPESQ